MANTNFAALTNEQLTVWSRDFWQETRNKTFIMSFSGSSENSMVQRITELSKTTDGARAVITLVNEAVGDGVVGDNTLEGNEEALRSTEDVIQLDQWRHAHRNTGKMSEQKSVVKFRNEARSKLANRMAQICDELAFLTLSGVAYSFKTDGTSRIGSQLPDLAFGADVSAPSTNRRYRWDATSGLILGGSTGDLDTADTPSWKMLVEMKAKAVNSYIKPLMSDNGVEGYNVFMHPDGIAKLKQDSDFLQAWRHARERGDGNPIFKGTAHGGKSGIYIDGLNILEYRNVYHPNTWGAGTLPGQRILLCGAQALGFADIGGASWDEESFDYGNVNGISVGKIFGLLKPKLFSTYTNSVEDFGVICVDTAR